MGAISDFTEHELWVVRSTLQERYGEPVEPEMAESEMRLDPHSSQLVACPTLYWEHQGCHFVICKTGDRHYRCQFYYRLYEMFGTGIDAYDDISECIVSLLQAQADHEITRSNQYPENLQNNR